MSTEVINPTPSEEHLELARQACIAAGDPYEDTVEALARLLAARNPGTMLLVFKDTQSGKSALQRAIFHIPPEFFGKKKLGFIWLTQKSQTSLFDQNEGSLSEKNGFKQSFYNDGAYLTKNESAVIIPIMMSGGAEHRPMSTTKARSRIKAAQELLVKDYGIPESEHKFVLDEVQIAVGINSQLDGLATRLCGSGVLQDEHDVLGFTATPQIYFDTDTAHTASVSVLPLPSGKGYVGHKDLLPRIQSFPGLTISSFRDRLPKEPGYIIVRLPQKSERAEEVLETVCREEGMILQYYTSEKSDAKNVFPIWKLLGEDGRNGRLEQHHDNKRIVIGIKGALSAGDDLMLHGVNRRKYITAAFHDRFTNAMAIAQDIGRYTGYSITDTFPIYINEKGMIALHEHIQFSEELHQYRRPKVRSKRTAGKEVLLPDWSSIKVGTHEDYLQHPTSKMKDAGNTSYHSEGLFSSMLRKKKALRCAATRFITFDYKFKDPAERYAQAAVKTQYGVKPGQGIWFTNFKKKVRKARTCLQA